MLKPVVVGVEDKQPSALKFAAHAASDRGVDLRVVYCVDPLLVGEVVGMPPESWAAAGQGTLDEAREILSELPVRPTAEYVLASGPAGPALREEAEHACLVVVGTDAPGRVDRFFDGSVAAYVAKHASTPVAIVPERRWSGDLTGGVFVALDAKTSAAGPLRYAFTEASRRDNALHVLHIARPDTGFEDTPVFRAEIAEILAGWSQEFPDVEVMQRLVFDKPDEGCLRASEEAELLVLGRFESIIPLPFQHPVLTQIVRRTHCPCVIVPDEWSGEPWHA